MIFRSIPIFRLYLIRNYLKLFLLSLIALIFILMLAKAQEVALLFSRGLDVTLIPVFVLGQIPYTLPIAIAFSSLIASTTLLYQFTLSGEIDSWRVCGLSFTAITRPILSLAMLITLATLAVTAHLIPYVNTQLEQKIRHVSFSQPLFMLQHPKILPVQTSCLLTHRSPGTRDLHELIFLFKQHPDSPISLCLGKQFQWSREAIRAKQLSYITYLSSSKQSQPPTLFLERREEAVLPKPLMLSQQFHSPGLVRRPEYLPMHQLLTLAFLDHSLSSKRKAQAQYRIFRRLFFPSITLAFSCIGIVTGYHMGRTSIRRSLYILLPCLMLPTLGLTASRSCHLCPLKAAICLFAPPVMLITLSYYLTQRKR